MDTTETILGRDIVEAAENSAAAARVYLARARQFVSDLVEKDGLPDQGNLQRQQRALHGLAWVATVVEALAQTAIWGRRTAESGELREIDRLVIQIGFGEYLAQLAGGIPMGPNEICRPYDLGLKGADDLYENTSAQAFLDSGNTPANRSRLIALFQAGEKVSDRLDDEDLEMIRETYRRFTEERITPHAQDWHLRDTLIPDNLVSEMAELGTFGICIDEEYGGLGLGKLAMCVVTEELSFGWIAAGSLGTRSEIAGELISTGGTEKQKSDWLPHIASGDVLPTAVFTEPDTGSDLGALRTRASRGAEGWVINGNKTWITHAGRSDVMTMLVRTDPESSSYDGLSMLIAPKPRGTETDTFPAEGMTGSEIEVLGYRGMKEYELSFDGFKVPAEGVLGGKEGQGFKQLMRTFEGARIQTAARAIGVARTAFDLGFRYAQDRKQFGEPIISFPRISDKLAMMLVEVTLARELTHFSAREKDLGRRCDIEAGMAKLLAARVAWTNADAALQIHGGNGYSMEFEISRVLCDARILNIFEGAAEIQAQVVGRGLLSGK
ncbi:acyl-CoA dehydrogenase family protein [Sedimentitalea sp.]|uniref:acyl-CoA dehydrogenase family protein n=1 Tax=Sedimentitalea sp. TaxID=2048915 RepID=UPI0032988FFF